ncbi:dephosphocoenzyme A kinase [marine gamma proteobacterium HTCC2207]|uniref:Dephospho-CoA kinase n=1 Tax=gamma proteobacterium HTCC2207 TaxID=314287 RepID=Q1YSB9_9GAMM|nr:dephosphocoenzyme A kinase [marine gamma proteobacterium HTCC2207] [gamma proteobacterium HTCC2207]
MKSTVSTPNSGSGSSSGSSSGSGFSSLIIGLTGGIGSGKSTVAEAFRQLGIETVDADQASRAVVEPGMPALAAISAQFGSQIIQADGSLDRAALRQIIFTDPAQKLWLESLLHPLIRDWIIEQLKAATSPYVILESPLLFETDQHQLVHKTVLVDLPEALQIERACARDGNQADQIQRIIDAQMPRVEKLSRADIVLDNSESLDTLAARVTAVHQTLLSLPL